MSLAKGLAPGNISFVNVFVPPLLGISSPGDDCDCLHTCLWTLLGISSPGDNCNGMVCIPVYGHCLEFLPPKTTTKTWSYPFYTGLHLFCTGNNPTDVCKLCTGQNNEFCTTSDKRAGFDGAFRCVAERAGDLTFLRHDTVQMMTDPVLNPGTTYIPAVCCCSFFLLKQVHYGARHFLCDDPIVCNVMVNACLAHGNYWVQHPSFLFPRLQKKRKMYAQVCFTDI